MPQPRMDRPHFPRLATLLAFGILIAGAAGAGPPLRDAALTAPLQRPVSPPGFATVQYNQGFDDALAAAFVAALGPERTLRFRYQKDWPDDHAFPNGLKMQQIHEWLTRMIDEWNREPLMPLRLQLDRGQTSTPNVIHLDDTGSDTGSNAGSGGYSSQYSGGHLKFQCKAALNVRAGVNPNQEEMEATAKHELGHCMLLGHTCNRSAAMAYTTGYPEWEAHTGFFALDDLLGLRSLWARNAAGFGGLAGRLRYPDGTAVGAGDVAALDDDTGEVVATSLSDRKRSGYFRIELPAGRHIRLVAHPLHADFTILGKDFLAKDLLTPGDFAPTPLLTGDRSSVFLVPDGATQDLGDFMVTPPADTPLLNRDAPDTALLPGERHHLAFRFNDLGSGPVQVRLSLARLTASNVTTHGTILEFDVAAAPAAAGVSAVEVQRGDAVNFQVGSIWVRPPTGVVRATGIDPRVMLRGDTTDLLVQGLGLERVTGARLVRERSTTELPATLVGPATDGTLLVRVTLPANAADGPWRLVLQTPEGDAVRPPEPQPRLWAGRGNLRVDPAIDAGDVPVGKPVQFSVPVTNVATTHYRFSGLSSIAYVGSASSLKVTAWPEMAPGATGQLRLALTPSHAGPTVVTLLLMGDKKLDAVTELRLWAAPPPSGG